MKTQHVHLFIISENALVVNGLRHYLENQFGSAVRISSFYDVKSLLKKIDAGTDAIIVDHLVEGKKGSDVIRSVQMLNPGTQGIYHTSAPDVAQAVSALLHGFIPVDAAPSIVNYTFDETFKPYYARL